MLSPVGTVTISPLKACDVDGSNGAIYGFVFTRIGLNGTHTVYANGTTLCATTRRLHQLVHNITSARYLGFINHDQVVFLCEFRLRQIIELQVAIVGHTTIGVVCVLHGQPMLAGHFHDFVDRVLGEDTAKFKKETCNSEHRTWTFRYKRTTCKRNTSKTVQHSTTKRTT